MSNIVVAKATTTLFIDSQRIHIIQGSAWAAESTVVVLNPDLFSDDPRHALGLDIVPPAREANDPPVEQKTAGPGELSNARKPRRGVFGNR